MSRFWQLGKPYKWAFLAGFAFLLLTNGLNLWIPWLLRDAVDAMESGEPLSTVARLAMAMIGIALAQAVVRTISRLLVLGASRKVAYDLRNTFFAQLQRLGASFYDRNRTGDLMSRGVNDIQIIQSFYGPGMLNSLNTTIVYVAVLILLFRIDVGLTLISLTFYPVLLFVVNRLARHTYSRSVAVQEQLGEISSRAQENLSGIQQVKTYVQEAREIQVFSQLCDEFRTRNLALARTRGSMISVMGIASGAATLIVMFAGGQRVIAGSISLGDFVAFNAYVAMLAWPTIALGWIINVFQRGAGAMRRVDELLNEQPDLPVAAEQGAQPGFVEGDIEIRDLTWSHPADEGSEPARPALRNLNLTIPRGSRYALVGPVGSGKSTLADLLARVYPVEPGKILIGGRDINDIPVDVLRRSVGYVPQEAFLFSQSIRDNIALRDPDASDEVVARAVTAAHLDGDLAKFPQGLETVVGERGFTLSGGQRQRTTLARALVGTPPLLILDDTLSAVDADTEKAILEELMQASQDRTCLLISHRLSTLSGADRVIVLDEGSIVDQGSHEELVQREGLYSRLFVRQQLEQRLDVR
ncbi:hypothetical protein ABI59_23040 [Acidobacteria bacterium Mor1]|nr:hypothetical protein ABI59_23040 [Acidobacteria bacterium Mor1]